MSSYLTFTFYFAHLLLSFTSPIPHLLLSYTSSIPHLRLPYTTSIPHLLLSHTLSYSSLPHIPHFLLFHTSSYFSPPPITHILLFHTLSSVWKPHKVASGYLAADSTPHPLHILPQIYYGHTLMIYSSTHPLSTRPLLPVH